MRLIDLTGQRFDRLVVLGHATQRTASGGPMWRCRCDCGTETSVVGSDLRRRFTKSCGCLHRVAIGNRHRTHDRSQTVEYAAWVSAKQRCENHHEPSYRNYGGRGITMCPEWRESFAAFFRDMGSCPPGHSLDRWPNVNGSYAPNNCRWATAKQQMNNTRVNHRIAFGAENRTLAEWTDVTGLARSTLAMRLARGWSIERALTAPAIPRRQLTTRSVHSLNH